MPLPGIAIGLRDPVPNRLCRRLELAGQLLRIASAPHERDELPPDLRRVWRATLGIVNSSSLERDLVSTKPGQLQLGQYGGIKKGIPITQI